MKKVLTVVGARPQFIKAAPVSNALIRSTDLREVLVHTGQHYDVNMSRAFFDDLDLPPPKYNLGVGSGTHGVQTAEIMKRLEPVLVEECPDLVMVYGDTNSTVAGALTASKLHILVAHVEAGLRSFNRKMPEEINRVVTDHLSTLLFCPTRTAVDNLRREGISENVFVVGDVMYDVALQFAPKAKEKSCILSNLGLQEREYILATLHRAENVKDKGRLYNILCAMKELAREMNIVLPLHPGTLKMVREFHYESLLRDLLVVQPVGFLDMISLERNAILIVTDSGGVQKEAYFHSVPCVTLRYETEWIETLEAQWNTLAPVDSIGQIIGTIRASLAYTGTRYTITDYGDGSASQDIIRLLASCLNGKAVS